ncbi:capsular biosynthesis protein [Brevundimonas faecalis]|uniref:capsular polysaccharide export protein, LipB/KpsS family n=1 Tax=Brevundimonas faecalis TaxID=947378 RepID=UPI00361AB540
MLAPFDPDHPETLLGTADDLRGRRFLIVTAPFGRFGGLLARNLVERGAFVARMAFNAGDPAFCRHAERIAFKDEPGAWPEKVRALATEFTDLVLFGEGGAYNQGVLSQGDILPATVWVLENGYFRPDWITMERGGVNASSSLPRRAEDYAVPSPELPVTRQVGKILPYHIVNISRYHLLASLGAPLYPAYKSPYSAAPWRQFLGHVWRYLGLLVQSRRALSTSVIAARGPFFIACLQREGDAQLLRYSRFADNAAFLAEVMDSFARHAPADCRLVVKNHPLDPGLANLRAITARLASERGLSSRVDFIDGGNLAQLCRASLGMVVNNSSAALSALGFHTPVKVMGQAFFDFEGLTDQQPLAGFWKKPVAADPELFTRFRAHVIDRTQINGNYHEPRAMKWTAQAVAQAFTSSRAQD